MAPFAAGGLKGPCPARPETYPEIAGTTGSTHGERKATRPAAAATAIASSSDPDRRSPEGGLHLGEHYSATTASIIARSTEAGGAGDAGGDAPLAVEHERGGDGVRGDPPRRAPHDFAPVSGTEG